MEAIANFFSPQLIWFFIGLGLVLLEFIIPGVIIVFFGIGAWVTSLLMVFFNFGINTQLVIFLASSLILLVILRKKVQNMFVGKSNEADNIDIDQVVGTKVKVVEKIGLNDKGKVLFNGTNWNAISDVEIAENEIVEIIEKDNLTLKVKPLKEEK